MSAGIVKVMFIAEPNRIGGKIVQIAEHSWQSHVAIIIGDYMWEAVFPAVEKHQELDRYKDFYYEIKEIAVPNIEAAIAEADSLVGKPYGYPDCVSGAIYHWTGKQVVLCDEGTIDCSELGTRVVRAGEFEVLPDVSANCIIPEDLYNAL
jgi:hypothetical protein